MFLEFLGMISHPIVFSNPSGITSPGAMSVTEIAYPIIKFILQVFIIIAIGSIPWSIVYYFSSGGDGDRQKSANAVCLKACIRLVCAVLALYLLNFTKGYFMYK